MSHRRSRLFQSPEVKPEIEEDKAAAQPEPEPEKGDPDDPQQALQDAVDEIDTLRETLPPGFRELRQCTYCYAQNTDNIFV